MSSSRKIVRALGVLAAVVVLALALYANHSWGNYHWARTSNPFTLQLGDNLSSAWDAHLSAASSDWNRSSVLQTAITGGGSNPKNCRPTSGRVEVCNSRYGNNGWLGLAQIWISGEHIVQGVVKLNDTYFNTRTYDTPSWRQYVVCQEVGHTFGLDHQDENFYNSNLGSCMDYTNDPAGTNGQKSNESPNTHDYDQLATIYQHLDNFSTVGDGSGSKRRRMPPAMTDIELTGPAQWGRVVRGSRARGTTVHELDFGGGHKVFTFVIWAR